MTVPKPVFSASVREIVAFALTTGDLGGEREFVGPGRALAGIRGHQKLQRSRPAGYQKEVPVACELEGEGFSLRIQGRIDGLLVEPEGVLLEEIKTVRGRWEGVADPLHWAQAKIYACIYARQHAIAELEIKLTYLHLETGKIVEFQQHFLLAELVECFEQATGIYLEWVREYFYWCRERDASASRLAFPFSSYRPGQREVAVAAYRALTRGGRLFLEAPTGIGKTMSVLFPAIKALGEGKLERIFYLTARTSGRAVAEKACSELRRAGVRLRSLTLTAKEKVCVNQGQPCDTQTCPLARGYYDRNQAAMREALQHEELTRPALDALARRHQVCPFELALDVSVWVDAVICDYNYVFDPKVYLRRHFGETARQYAFLVDEAHNLVDRGREMFSADLSTREAQETARAVKVALPRCAKALRKLAAEMRALIEANAPEHNRPDGTARNESPEDASNATLPLDFGGAQNAIASKPGCLGKPGKGTPALRTTKELPAGLGPAIDETLEQAELWLATNEPSAFRERLLEVYFRLNSFRKTMELYDGRYVTIVEKSGPAIRVRLFCLDPSFLLREALGRGKAAIFFSATLTPLEYYRELLGGSSGDPTLKLLSPFPPEHLAVLVQDRIRTDFKARAETLTEVARAIGVAIGARRGNYLVYLPSYQYLKDVEDQFRGIHPAVRALSQRPGMTETEREAFLAAFTTEHRETLVGFAVLGGVFGEGIDLVGERLNGVVVVGVGLPQLCIERDLIRAFFQEKEGSGFDYAYTFPGMNRVLQATGRVIRTETDRGIVLLIDARFAEPRYRRLLPAWWRPINVRQETTMRESLSNFWDCSDSAFGAEPAAPK